MSIAEKLTLIAENQQKVYDAGKAAGGIELVYLNVENHGATGRFLMYTTVENGKAVSKVAHDGYSEDYGDTTYGGGGYEVIAGSMVVLSTYQEGFEILAEDYLERIYTEVGDVNCLYIFKVTADGDDGCCLDF